MSKRIHDYLVTKKNIFLLLVFIAIFSLLFINVYIPFDSANWLDTLTPTGYFFRSSLIVSIGLFVLVVSRIIMYYVHKKAPLHFANYYGWILGEIIVMALIYTFLAKLIMDDPRDFFDIFPKVILYIFLTIFIPYTVAWLYMALKNLEAINSKMAAENTVPNLLLEKSDDKLTHIYFCDNKGAIHLSVRFSNLYYLESSDNYVTVVYENRGNITRSLLRRSMKSIETDYPHYPLVRCHRSYIVNKEKVKVLKRTKEGMFLDLNHKELPLLPVSKSYSETIIDILTKA